MAAAVASGDSGYRIVGKWPAAGSGRKWDYLIVDAPHHHLFVSRATHVQAFDLDFGKLAGDIDNTPGVHGIALCSDPHRGFTSNGKADSVTVFNLENLEIITEVQTPGSISKCHHLRCAEQTRCTRLMATATMQPSSTRAAPTENCPASLYRGAPNSP